MSNFQMLKDIILTNQLGKVSLIKEKFKLSANTKFYANKLTKIKLN